MITILAAQIFIQAFFLCLILYLVARYEADYSFQKVAMVSGGVMAGTLIIEVLAGEKLGLFVVIPQIAFIAFMLMTFCWISLWKSLLVVVLFSLIHVGFSFGVLALKTQFFGPDDGMTSSERAEQQFKELEQEMLKTMGVWPEGEGGGDKAPGAQGVAGSAPGEGPPRQGNAAKPARPAAQTPGEIEQADTWTAARRRLDIGGVMSAAGGKRVVLINGVLFEKDDKVSVKHEGFVYRWRVRSVGSDGADLQPLKRKPLDDDQSGS